MGHEQIVPWRGVRALRSMRLCHHCAVNARAPPGLRGRFCLSAALLSIPCPMPWVPKHAPLLLALIAWQLCCSAAWVGVNFALARMSRPLGPREGAGGLRDAFVKVKRFRTYTYDAAHLGALQAAGATHVMVGVPNEELAGVARDVTHAHSIVGQLARFAGAMQLSVAMGSQPLAPWRTNAYAPHLVRAVARMRGALEAAGLARAVKVTVPYAYNLLSTTYPPPDARFGGQYATRVRSVCEMLRDDGGFFTINIHPWFSYRTDPSRVPLSLALLTESHTVGGVTYDNLLLMQLAAVRAALLRLDATFTEARLPIVVGETGWPTAGHADATVGNAATYVNNVVRLGLDGRADVYLFEAFDEQEKQALLGTIQDSTEEKNFGVLREDRTPKYDIPALRAVVGLNFALKPQGGPRTPGAGARAIRAALGRLTHYRTPRYDAASLSALEAAGATHVVLGVPRAELPGIAGDVARAHALVRGIAPFGGRMQLSLAVGGQSADVLWSDAFQPDLLGAVARLRAALGSAGLQLSCT